MSTKEIPSRYIEAASRAISLNLPFALFAMPGSRKYSFFASRPDEVKYNAIDNRITNGNAFFITRFASPLSAGFMIKDQISAGDLLRLPSDTLPWPGAELSTRPTSTTYPNYYGQIRKIRRAISHHKINKAVISRRIAVATDLGPMELAEKYFASLPDTFRAIFFTQETGLWLTATPELLLSARSEGDDDEPIQFEAMSLAGTRQPSPDETWDDKNSLEHNTVLDFIYHTLQEKGLDPEIHEPEILPFGNVEHLCHKITATGHSNIFELIDSLSPTPALGGYPVAPAVKLIGETELHNRLCYGGIVGTVSETELRAYVNIRCAQLSPEQTADGKMMVNIFAGGGIMKQSNPRQEWLEAASKAMPLYSLLQTDSPKEIFDIPAPWDSLK